MTVRRDEEIPEYFQLLSAFLKLEGMLGLNFPFKIPLGIKTINCPLGKEVNVTSFLFCFVLSLMLLVF